MKLGIVAITHDRLWVQYETPNGWKQSKIPYHEFISFMWDNFPEIMKKSIPYHFDSENSVANWLYNYGDYNDGTMCLFNDHNNNRYFTTMHETIDICPPKHIVEYAVF